MDISSKEMADEIHYSAIIRVGFYSTDVGTDWYNGYNFFNFTQNATPSSTSIDMCDRAQDQAHDPIWGTWTIGLSWVPAVFGSFSVQEENPSWRNVILFPIRFILWPILVALQM